MVFKIHLINSIQSDALNNLYILKAKTDKKDSLFLSDLVRLGQAPAARLAPETTTKLQTLSRLRLEFVRQVGRFKNRVLDILDHASIALLKEYPETELLAEADLSELTSFLKQRSRGLLTRDRVEQIQVFTKGTFGIRLAMDAFTLELKLLMEQIEFIEKQVAVLEEAISKVLEELREKS